MTGKAGRGAFICPSGLFLNFPQLGYGKVWKSSPASALFSVRTSRCPSLVLNLRCTISLGSKRTSLIPRLVLQLDSVSSNNADPKICAEVIDSVTKVAKRLNEIRESYNNVALNTTLVASQLSTIRAALEALYAWRASDRDSTGPSRQLDEDLGMSLSCCAILIRVIDGKLDESGYMPGLKQKIKYLWLENILKEYVSNLEGQVRALQLLLTIFQCRTETEKRQKLANEESRTIIEQVRAETASLALGNIDSQDAASVLSLDPSVTFDIDSILMKSPAYKRVYGDARRRLHSVVSTSPIGNSEPAAQPAPTPVLSQTLHPPPLPPRQTRKPMPQSRGRINVWDYYPGEKEEDQTREDIVMADSSNVFELPGETQVISAVSQLNEESKEQDILLQREEKATQGSDRETQIASVESSMGSVSENKPFSIQTERTVATALPDAVDDTEQGSALDGLMKQLNLAFVEKSRDLGLLYETAVLLKTEESSTVAIPRDEASQAVPHKGSKELGRHSKSQSEDLSLDLSRRIPSREGIQRPMSTHSSLYERSIIAGSKEQSTRTSSPYSCISCKNISATEQVLESDKLEAEVHDLVRSGPQPEPESTSIKSGVIGNDLNSKIPELSQPIPVSPRLDTLNESQSQPAKDVLHVSLKSTTFEQQTHDMNLTASSAAPVDNLARSEFEDLNWVETSRSNAGLGLRHVRTPETGDLETQESKNSFSSMLAPPRLVNPARPSSSKRPPAVLFSPPAEHTSPESEQSTRSSFTPSSAHDAATTSSSSEALEDSTILSVQQSTSCTTATSISTHAPGLDQDQTHSDLRRLQDELAAAKVRGDSRAVQNILQRSIEVTRRKYLAGPAADNNALANSPNPRSGRALPRFLSLSGSAKGTALGDFAASGKTLPLQDILKQKVNVDSRSDNFKTPLMRAVMNGHIDCMKLLKQSGADEVAVDAKGRTVLHMAVASNRLDVVKWLLDAYPPPNPNALKQRPSILFRATDAVKGVRSQKNLRETSDAEGSKPLHIAAELDKGGMVKVLLAAGVDIESKDNWGRTPFHRAIIAKRRDSFDTLLRSGANIAAIDANSISPLHLAAQAGQVDMIKTLLANGAKRWDFDACGNQPVHSAVQGGNPYAIEALVMDRTDCEKRTKSGETPLHLACLKKDLELAKYLFTKLVDVNPWGAPSPGVVQVLSRTRIKGSSMTPLHYACCFHDFEMAVLLLDHEALVNAPTPEGATALMMAVETENTNLVNLLLQRGAKVNAKIPGSLVTALHLAARRGDLDTVQQLCRHHADIDARTSGYSRSAMDESMKCPDKNKGQAVEKYIRTIVMNRLYNNVRARANTRKHQASLSESHQPYCNPPGVPPANPISYTPSQHGYAQNQGYVAQQTQTQNLQYYHPDFDVLDDTLPAYEPGPNAPARLANQAAVHRERYT